MKKGLIFSVLFVLVVAGVAAGAAINYGENDRLPEGYNVAGLSVGGKTPDEALKQVQARIRSWRRRR